MKPCTAVLAIASFALLARGAPTSEADAFPVHPAQTGVLLLPSIKGRPTDSHLSNDIAYRRYLYPPSEGQRQSTPP